MRKFLCLLALLLGVFPAIYAQNVEVTGKVTDETGAPIAKASVVEKKSRKGTSTDADGKFKLNTKAGSVLLISYVGYGAKEIVASAAAPFTISLAPANQALNEVVVTALGIRREKKALGYSVSTVNKKDLELRPEGDIGRLLSGKAAGVNVLGTSGLSGSGTNIIVRGINTISGQDVAPLFIVDGVPFDASTNAQSDFYSGNQTSSRFLDIDPNNIESLNILKGLSATTLYGQRGRNGVIVITTKNGAASFKTNKKLEITFSQSFFANQVANLPDYQDTYGGGFNLEAGPFYSNWGAKFGTIDSIGHPYDRSALTNDFPQFTGKKYAYKPYNSVRNFFKTGLVSTSSVNIAAGGANTSLNASYTYMDDQGFTPGNFLHKNNIGIGGSAKLSNRFTLNGTVNYVITDYQSPITGVSFGGSSGDAPSLFANLIYTPRSIDLMGLPYKNPRTGASVYYRNNNDIQNPIWTSENALTTQRVNRAYGSMQLKYDIIKGLSAMYKFGYDYTNEFHSLTVNKGGSGDAKYASGIYRTVNGTTVILDNTLLLTFNKTFKSIWNLNVDAGINDREDRYEQNGVLNSQQLIFGLMNARNFISQESEGESGNPLNYGSKQKELGVFIQGVLGFQDWVYLSLGGRNSWVSTLDKGSRSLFYPSGSISFIPTTAIKALEGKVINYLKLRAGASTSARFPGPYNTRAYLRIKTKAFIDQDGVVINNMGIPNELPNPGLKPELQKEFEIGSEAKFLNNRLSVDFTWYKRTSRDQILDRPMDPASGYTTVKVNAGSLENRGIELGLGYTAIRSRNFRWQIDANFSNNKSRVYDMPKDISQIVIAGFTNLGTIATNDQPLGVLFGTYVQTDPKSGQLMVDDATGYYIHSVDQKVIGNPNPNYKLNITNTFSYKGLSFRMQWDYTDGGDMYSGTVSALLGRGLTKDTEFDRTQPVVLPGVAAHLDPVTGKYIITGQNAYQISAQQAYFYNLGLSGADDRAIYDATILRLREASISYNLPESILKKSPFGAASFTVSGQNLWYYAPNFPKYTNFDPETTSLGVGNSTAGFDFLTAPSSRRLGISLKLSF